MELSYWSSHALIIVYVALSPCPNSIKTAEVMINFDLNLVKCFCNALIPIETDVKYAA